MTSCLLSFNSICLIDFRVFACEVWVTGVEAESRKAKDFTKILRDVLSTGDIDGKPARTQQETQICKSNHDVTS